MKKIFSVICVFISMIAVAQNSEKSKVISSVLCECLENAEKEGELKDDFQGSYNECQKAAIMTAALSVINIKKDTTITLNPDATLDTVDQTDMEASLEMLQNDCDVFNKYKNSAVNIDRIVMEVTEKACECVSKIETDLSQKEKNQGIKGCTVDAMVSTNSIQKAQLGTVEKMRSFSKRVSDNMVENCPAIKKVIFSNDEEKLNSYSTNEKALEFYSKGIKFMETKNYEKAIKSYKKAVKMDPKFVFAWDNLGRSYRLIHKYDDAIDSYKKSFAIDSLNPTSCMNMAVAYNYKKDYENAEFWYEKLIEINPKDPEGHYGLALTFMNQKKLEGALNKAIDARTLYLEIESPYAADAEKMMRYLYQMFKEEEKEEVFRKICAANNITLD